MPQNLLLINADQLRHDCVGYRGMRGVKTPHLDAMARESIRYTNAFTPLPVCAPARQALLCGRHPDSFGAQWNYDFLRTPTVQPEWSWVRNLRNAGYSTAYLGRFHVSPDKTPKDFGYDTHVSWAGHKALLKEKYPDVSYTGGWLGCESPVALEDSGTHWMADQACETLEKLVSEGRPWHMWVDYEEPHLPCRPSFPFSQMYDPKDIAPWDGFYDDFKGKPYIHAQQPVTWQTNELTWGDFSQMIARYYGVVSQLDDAIGKIFDKLKALGQYENTIIVFTSDHGDMCGDHHMLDKHYVLYDDITRVPLFVRVPGVANCEMRSFVSNCLDLPRSFIKWLDLPVPEVLHGKVLPLTPEEDAQGRKEIVCTSNGQQFGLYTTRMIRDERYKYVWNLTDVDELYDMAQDPGELHNLSALPEYASLISDMRVRLQVELLSHGDAFAGNEWMQHQLLDGAKLSSHP